MVIFHCYVSSPEGIKFDSTFEHYNRKGYGGTTFQAMKSCEWGGRFSHAREPVWSVNLGRNFIKMDVYSGVICLYTCLYYFILDVYISNWYVYVYNYIIYIDVKCIYIYKRVDLCQHLFLFPRKQYRKPCQSARGFGALLWRSVNTTRQP